MKKEEELKIIVEEQIAFIHQEELQELSKKTELDVEDIVINIPDTSVEEFKEELLKLLVVKQMDFNTHAMSDYSLFLKGQKDMLGQIILLIHNT